ncbi:DUF6883 domain-containing protein [Nostoc sp.]|uniref:DUF6883 domain-containing protein n=1 Tax=Nostoc sp. TaxID=1180 RepID=UPI002FF48796
MKIPDNIIIPEEKVTCYLLVPRIKDDKSKFLAQAGFTQNNPEDLLTAIRQLATTNEVVEDNTNEYGTFYTIAGYLQGVNGQNLAVITVWLQSKHDGSFRFITLRRVQLSLRPNPQPLPYKGRGARIKASLPVGYSIHTSRIYPP